MARTTWHWHKNHCKRRELLETTLCVCLSLTRASGIHNADRTVSPRKTDVHVEKNRMKPLSHTTKIHSKLIKSWSIRPAIIWKKTYSKSSIWIAIFKIYITLSTDKSSKNKWVYMRLMCLYIERETGK